MIAASVPLIVFAGKDGFDPNSVTPGVWGFVLTFVVMVVVVLLVFDMVRRIRRVNYRAELREQIEQERLDGEQQHLTEGDAPDDERPRGASDR